jgi:CAAX protease family protein
VTSRTRFLLGQGLKLGAGAACLESSILVFRFLLHPAIASALSLGEAASTVVRRAGIFAVALLAYAAFVRFYERRAAGELSLRPRWTLVAAAAGAMSIGLTIVFLLATGLYQVESFRGFGGAPGVLVVIAIAAVLEELAFRALLFRILEETAGSTAALVVSALGFCVAHLANNGVQPITLVTITLAGLMWAGLFIVWRNVWVAAAHHACWNATIFLIGVPLSGEEDWRALAPWVTSTRGSTLWTGGSFGPEDSLVNIAVMVILCAGLFFIARRRGRWVASPLLRSPAPAACSPAHEAGRGGPRSLRPATPASP